MNIIRIALDGPGGSGKSTLGRRLAQILGFTYIDTGAMYRSLALDLHERGIALDDRDALARRLAAIDIDFDPLPDGTQRVLLDGRDVTAAIRTAENSRRTSAVAAIPAVREAMVHHQQQMARTRSVVMDGRDIGSVVLPDAELKVYLDASAEVRAQRRCDELADSRTPQDYADVLAQIRQRDREDMEREHSPLVRTEDAWYIDSTELDAEQVLNLLLARAEKLQEQSSCR